MKVPASYYDQVFDFKGQWDLPSKCGLKIVHKKDGRIIVIVTELYQENPGTSVTYAAGSLLQQICAEKGLDGTQVIYLECNPDTHSKLSFYDEEYFRVVFEYNGDAFVNPKYTKLTNEELHDLLA